MFFAVFRIRKAKLDTVFDSLPDVGLVFNRHQQVKQPTQNFFGIPACLRMPLAVLFLLTVIGTGKGLPVIGLYQNS